MNEVVITVRGECERRVPAEHAVVRMSVRADGPERGPVVERAQSRAEAVQDGLVAHQRSEEIAEWSSGRVSVWSERPWNSEGVQLPVVHNASVELTATFTDAVALSWWLGDVAELAEVQVSDLQWHLSPETRSRVEREVAAAAVHVAVARAEAYADALGMASVVPLEIADVGMLGTRAEASAPPMARAMVADAVPSFSVQPADITVSATVEARFRAE